MNTSIYYDLEEVSLDDIRRARRRAPGAVEFVARGTSWPAGVEGPHPCEVPNSREFGYHEELMEWVQRLFEALERGPAARVLVRQHDSSLLEVLRYRFLLEFADVEQRWRAICEMSQSEAQPIKWVAPPRRCRRLAGLIAGRTPIDVEFLTALKSAREPSPLWGRARSLVREALDWVSDRFAHATRRAPALPSAVGTPLVFVEYFPNSAKVLVPVANALRERHAVDVVWIAARKAVAKLLDEFGISSVDLRQLSPRTHRTRNHFGPEARRELRAALDHLPDELFCGTGGVTGRAYLLPSIYELLTSLLGEAAYWFDSFTEAFELLKPRCVVSTTYSSTIGRATFLVGRALGASTVSVQHGMFPDRDYFTHFCNDILLLWGEANRRTMLRNGIADERIKVVGATIYDDLIERCQLSGPSHFPKLGEPIRVAYLASRTAGAALNYSRAQSCLTAVAEAVRRIPNGQLEVKTHPGDKTGMAPAVLQAYPGFVVANEGSSQDVLCRCDVAIVVSSTTGVEACMADKPLIVLQVPGVPDYGPYQEYGAALEISLDNPEASQALTDEIQSLSSNPAKLESLANGRRRLIDDLLNGGAGNATELTTNVIAELAANRNQTLRNVRIAK